MIDVPEVYIVVTSTGGLLIFNNLTHNAIGKPFIQTLRLYTVKTFSKNIQLCKNKISLVLSLIPISACIVSILFQCQF